MVIVSICGPAGSGKSQLAKALVAHLGPVRCARVPTDYFLIPACEPLPDYFARPLRYDWELLSRVLSLPEGTETSTPEFDFETFQRHAETGGRFFVVRPMMLIDAMAHFPSSDARVLINAPAEIRRARIAARDEVWNTRVRDRWRNLDITWARVSELSHSYDLELDGTRPLDDNAALLASWLQERFHLSDSSG